MKVLNVTLFFICLIIPIWFEFKLKENTYNFFVLLLWPAKLSILPAESTILIPFTFCESLSAMNNWPDGLKAIDRTAPSEIPVALDSFADDWNWKKLTQCRGQIDTAMKTFPLD